MLRYKIYVLFLFVFSIYTVNLVGAKNNELPLFGKVIYIDAGHGGIDPGATYKSIMEKDINLSISLFLEDKLVKMGAIVYLTRYGDYDLAITNTINRKRSDLSRRGNIINRSLCDLFVSIHLNAEETGIWRGPQVFYTNNNKNNIIFAEMLQNKLNDKLKNKRNPKKIKDIYLLNRINRTGVLIEAGFLSNSNDRYLLKQKYYQEKIAGVICESIVEYFGEF